MLEAEFLFCDVVVYLEDMTSARYIDNDAAEQERYGLVWNDLIRSALPPRPSAQMLTTLKKNREAK